MSLVRPIAAASPVAVLLLALAAAATAATPLLALAPVEPATAPTPSSPAWEEDMRRFAREDAERPPPRGAVLFVGSGPVQAWDLEAAFPGIATINRGFGGSQLRDATWYAGRMLVPAAPRMVVLYAGEEDLASGRTPQQVREDFRGFIEQVRRGLPQARIAYLAIGAGPARAGMLPAVQAANAAVRAEAARWKDVVFIDPGMPTPGADGRPPVELSGGDGLQLDGDGYALWQERLAPWLQP